MQQSSAEALLAAITQSGNEVTQGWMRILASAPPMSPEFQANSALQASYFEKQSLLWTSMLAGKPQSVVEAEAGDRRFAGREWRENPYYDYLKQSYLLASRYLADLVERRRSTPRRRSARASRRGNGSTPCAPPTLPPPIRPRCARRSTRAARA
jgi:hypothetical protein